MKILITSTSHPAYDQTGTIIEDRGSAGLLVLLDRSNTEIEVAEGQWKLVKIQDVPAARV